MLATGHTLTPRKISGKSYSRKKKRRISSFPSWWQARGGEVMERRAGRRTCLGLGVIASPGPQPVLAGAGAAPRPPCPSSPTLLPVKPPHPEAAPGLPARFQPPRAGNQPQMWPSSCGSTSGAAQGHGDSGRDLLGGRAGESGAAGGLVPPVGWQGMLPREG